MITLEKRNELLATMASRIVASLCARPRFHAVSQDEAIAQHLAEISVEIAELILAEVRDLPEP